jgi:hypothetical protein
MRSIFVGANTFTKAPVIAVLPKVVYVSIQKRGPHNEKGRDRMTYQQFMPHWKKQDRCFEDEQVEMIDSLHGHKIMKNGKPVIKPWPHDKPTAQISYENWLEKVVNPDTNEFYPARNKDGSAIKGTGAKHTLTQIIRFRRKDGKEFLYSLGECIGYDAFGIIVTLTCAKPEMWTNSIQLRAKI